MAVPLRAVGANRDYEVSFEDTPENQTVPGATLSALLAEIPSAPGSAIVYSRVRKEAGPQKPTHSRRREQPDAVLTEGLEALPKLPAPVSCLGKANTRRLKNPRQGRGAQ